MQVKIIECPRDAMQGWEHQIPTNKKGKFDRTFQQLVTPISDLSSLKLW